VLDQNLRILSANRTFLRAFALSEKDTVGVASETLLTSEQLQKGLRRSAETGAEFDEKAMEIAVHGCPTRYFNVKASVLHTGQRREILLVLNDVTEQLQMQEQIQKAERLSSLGTLTAGVAHELNTPLANVLLYTQMAREHVADDGSEIAENLMAVEEEAKRGAGIVKELLEFSRQSDLEVDVADINEILANLLSLVRNQCAMSKIRLEKNLDHSIPRIRADLGRLQQVFMNIVANAMWAMPDGGTLSVKTDYDREKQIVRISFGDTGIGVPKEYIARMGGEILVESSPAGKSSGEPTQSGGTTFTVEIPIGDRILG
jgi:two-component system NtrC family sensor kinase